MFGSNDSDPTALSAAALSGAALSGVARAVAALSGVARMVWSLPLPVELTEVRTMGDLNSVLRSAAHHYGVLLPDVLKAAGITQRQSQYRAKQGEWRRLESGIYVVAGHPESFEMHAIAALAAVPDSTLSHRSAASVWGMNVRPVSIVELTTTTNRRIQRRGVTVARSALHPRDVTKRGPFRLTTIERTVVDLAGVIGEAALLAVVEDLLIASKTTFERLQATVGRLCCQGRTGSARMGNVMATLDGAARSESELERCFVRLLEREGLGPLQRQVELRWGASERGRVDFADVQAKVIFELDGRAYHARLADFERDRRRDQAALVDGWRTVRISWNQLQRDRAWVVAVVRSAISNKAS